MLMDVKSSIHSFFSKKDTYYQVQKIDDLLLELKNNLLNSDISIDFINNIIQKIRIESIKFKPEAADFKKKIFTLLYSEIYSLLGNAFTGLTLAPLKMKVIVLCGTQGVGKTSFCIKLATHLERQKNSLRVAIGSLDNKRPAAQEQLKKSTINTDIDYITIPEELKSSSLAQQAFYLYKMAYQAGYSLIIIDTAGISPVNMFEIKRLQSVVEKINPDEVMLLIDSTAGQVATNIALKFNQFINITGIVLTKVEEQNNIGTAINIKMAVNKPIKYLSIGEKINDIEEFNPKRITKRMLNLKDSSGFTEYILNTDNNLIKNTKSTFDFNDLYQKLLAIKNNYNIDYILSFLPLKTNKNIEKNKTLIKEMAVILSMTYKERKDPNLIDNNRKQRIAKGSGCTLDNVEAVINRLSRTQKKLVATF